MPRKHFSENSERTTRYVGCSTILLYRQRENLRAKVKSVVARSLGIFRTAPATLFTLLLSFHRKQLSTKLNPIYILA
jgi:hypothetical protein